jgi:cell wall-associated NlpC family hydrolase
MNLVASSSLTRQTCCWLWLACAPLIGACASAGPKGTAIPQPFPVPASSGEAQPKNSRAAEVPRDAAPAALIALVDTAMHLRGTPYRNGGSTVDGFDCSGFTQFVFAHHGVKLPREVRDQFTVGRSISRDSIEPGDLIFFSTTSPGASHVAIAIGEGRFVHAPSSRGVVRVEDLATAYWSRRFVGVRRLPLR